MKQIFLRTHWIILIIFLGLVGTPTTVCAQSQFVPTNYDEPFRGQFHFSQQSGWMNDINGLWYLDGVYHLTYQADPYSLNGGHDGIPRYWGHATSPDMVHWTQLPTILDPGVNVPGECWSGSTVIDFNNTSGFGTAENPPLVSIYTATSKGTCLAYSLDKGFTWSAYSGNPVNVAGPTSETRDPKVFWYEPAQKWVCVIYENGFAFYNSPDLKTWTKTSTFGSGWGYECPDFFELAVDESSVKKYVLLRGDGNYYVGDFDGAVFTPLPGGPHRMVYNEGFGGSFYASQTFFQQTFPDGKVVQMAWMLGLGPGTTAPWTHNSTFPCELKLKTFPEGIRVTRNPVGEISALCQSTQRWNNLILRSGQNLFAGKFSKCFDMEVVLDMSEAKATVLTFQFADKLISYNIEDETLFGIKLKAVNNMLKLRFLVDWGGLEVFGNDGAYSYVENFRFEPSEYLISMTANGEIKLVSATLNDIDRIWSGIANNKYVDNAATGNRYTGNWIHATNEGGYYNSDCHIGVTANSSIEYTFKGRQISWYGLKNDDLGMATVYIDGEQAEDNIDCYSTNRVVQQLFTKTDLADGVHTIKVVVKGTKNPASKGIALVHDYFGFVAPPSTSTAADDISPQTTYGGNWTAFDNSNKFYNYTFHSSHAEYSTVEHTFNGTQIFWYGLKDSDLGKAAIYIDGDLAADNIDCYNDSPETTRLFAKTNLPSGEHTIKVEAKGTKNELSSGTGIVHDYFDSPAIAPTIIDDASTSTIYSGTWNYVTNENIYHNNTCHYNTSLTANIQQSFSGTQISWYGLKNNDLGKVAVYIDNVRVAEEIDCYSNDRKVHLLFHKTGLSSGIHTIKIESKQTKNPASSGYAMVHDYFTTVIPVSPSFSLTDTLSFGYVLPNMQATKSFTVSNTDVFPVWITSIDLPESYSCHWNNGKLLPNESKEIPVAFAPSEAKSYVGNIRVNTDSGVDSITVKGSATPETAINDIENNEIYLFPNPVKDRLTIVANDLNGIELLDINGKILLNWKQENQTTEELNMSNFSNGFYIVKIINKKGEYSLAKLIKK
ncbi:MAG: T9SS type A sorting domain-containing protein [Dysgonamonadaceae bacterium]|jgi:sucrose-6-phosphate hydrolase SacC (GH32 family)|nr:T9SS type A sorting domain-containing protein [Dysgonamonadaceae bacterium]